MLVEYHDETARVAESYEQAIWENNAPIGSMIAYADLRDLRQNPTNSATIPEHMSNDSEFTRLSSANSPTIEGYHQHRSPARGSPRQPEGGLNSFDSPTTQPRHRVDRPLNMRTSPRQQVASPLVTESPASSGSALTDTEYRPRVIPSIIPFTPREAELMRNFSENMALWVRIRELRIVSN